MPLNSAIPLQVQVPQPQSPIEAMGNAMSLAQMAQNRQINAARLQQIELQNQERKLEAQEQDAIQRAYGEVGGNITKLPTALSGKVRPDTIFKLQKSINDTIKAEADKDESLWKVDTAKRSRLRGIYKAASAAMTPESTPEQRQAHYNSAIQTAISEKLIKPGEVPDLYPGDDEFRRMGYSLATAEAIDAEVKAARDARFAEAEEKRKAAEHAVTLPGKEAYAAVKVRENAASQLAVAAEKSKDDYAQIWYGIRAQNPKLAGQFPHPDTWTKDTAKTVRYAGMTATQQQSANTAQLNAENNVSTMELELRAAKGDPVAKAALAAEEARRVRIAAAGRTINQDATKEAIEAAAQSLANGDLTRIRDITSMRSDQRILVFKRARELNPKFSTGEIDRKIKMQDWVDNGKGSEQIQSFGTFLEHAGDASDAVNNIRLTKSKIINRPVNWLRQNVAGDADYQSFMAALEPVRKEFEGFLLGGRALYAEDRRSAEVILDDNSSPAQIQAALKRLGHTAKARFNEMNHRYKRVMGQDIQNPFATEAVEGARKIGVDLSVGAATPNAPAASTPAPNGKIAIITPEGQPGFIPAEKWAEAQKRGFKRR